jgi:hypothetical protein
MYKSILVILLVGLLAAPTLAQYYDPPQQPGQNELPGGWGNNPNNWSHVTDEACPLTKAIWNPDANDGEGGWTICEGNAPICQTITVELWIELFASMTVFDLWHQVHMIADERDGRRYCGYIRGLTASNHPLDIILAPGLGQSLGFLEFQHSVIDGQGDYQDYPQNGRDIPVDWWVACAYGMYGDALPVDSNLLTYVYLGGGDDFDEDETYTMPYITSKCDWYWYFRFCFWVLYHEDDGYYVLYFTICPMPRV